MQVLKQAEPEGALQETSEISIRSRPEGVLMMATVEEAPGRMVMDF